MEADSKIGLKNVQEVYTGAEGDLWELIMGQQIHIGGYKSSADLAEKANIAQGSAGVDFCCCNGAGVRFLLRFRNVGKMTGVDATKKQIRLAVERTAAEGLDSSADFVLADACDTKLPSDSFDFVWGEDAWCYVEDKPKMITEAARILKPGGAIAFTDWVEGGVAMTDSEREPFLAFMKFPNFQTIPGYSQLLQENGFEIVHAHDTERFIPCIDLYLSMLDLQLTSDALRIIGYDMDMFMALGGEMVNAQKLAHEKKLVQGLFVARKK